MYDNTFSQFRLRIPNVIGIANLIGTAEDVIFIWIE